MDCVRLIVAAFVMGLVAVACGGDVAPTAAHLTGTPVLPERAGQPRGAASPTQTPGTQQQPPWRPGLLVAAADASNVRRIFDGEALLLRWSPDGHSIAFLGDRDGKSGAYVINPATGRARYVGASSAAQVRWSPDGRRLLLRPTKATLGAGHFATVDVRTGETRALPVDGIYAEWSPDGQRISFAGPRCRDGERTRIYDLRSDAIGTPVPRYPNASAYLSPDWTRVAFFRDRIFYNDSAPDPTLYVAGLDGGGERPLFTPPGGETPMRPLWSPDSKWIVYTTRSTGGMYLLRADGSGRPFALVRQGEFGEPGGWSADSTRLLVNAGGGGFLYNVRDSTKTAVRTAGLLSPDGTRIASSAGVVAIADVHAGTTAIVPTDASILAADVQWSPDSSAVAFIAASPKDYGPCI